MTDHRTPKDPEPAERIPAGPTECLYVPVRSGPAGHTARLFRTPLGGRTAIGFTSVRRLTAALGAEHEWIKLGEPALRALVAPLGCPRITIDPRFATRRAEDRPAPPGATAAALHGSAAPSTSSTPGPIVPERSEPVHPDLGAQAA
ncbi:SAV_915 family protein [Streptomyces zagrosensis]|uniref:SseB protein N-terminal domain-containing protein n=1 Tax=Streptomyces zagrosensis TaxID=1042984 RepID=A0A7W9UZM3_9ACTN|nr:SAV_915 family protein [Streptomyces zagrosensis]MBB5936887.1 hypothetical protein [Streptomyces zagrosensis]